MSGPPGPPRESQRGFCAWLVDGAFLLSRHCGGPLAAATCLASQHLFSRSQFEAAWRTRSSFARRANATCGMSLLQCPLMSLGVVRSKDFWLTCAALEEVKRVVAASRGAGRPKTKIQNQNQSRDVGDLLRWVGCGPLQSRSVACELLCVPSAVNSGDLESM